MLPALSGTLLPLALSKLSSVCAASSLPETFQLQHREWCAVQSAGSVLGLGGSRDVTRGCPHLAHLSMPLRCPPTWPCPLRAHSCRSPSILLP